MLKAIDSVMVWFESNIIPFTIGFTFGLFVLIVRFW